MSQVLHKWLEAIDSSASLKEWEDVRLKLMGKQGELTAMLKELGQMTPEERRTRGQEINQLKDAVANQLESRKRDLEEAALTQRLQQESLDVTLSARPQRVGSIHPVTQTIEEISRYFASFGFDVAEGPDIEDEEHNFNALNIPDHHPARQSHDTFYFQTQDGIQKLLRTHTSPVQIRTMRSQQPPIRIIIPGRTYRCDYDATHTPMFHQMEGLVIDRGIHMGHLKGCIIDFCRFFFGVDDLPVRFRPSFFPFTEPSAEVDIGCAKEGGALKIGAGADWLEILGCGMVHPNVLRNCNIDPEVYQGFAFGMGMERLTMLKYGMPDIRPLYESDTRWLKHYGFSPVSAA